MKAVIVAIIYSASLLLYSMSEEEAKGKVNINSDTTQIQSAAGNAAVVYVVVQKAEKTSSPVMEYITWGLVSVVSVISIVTGIIKLKKKNDGKRN